MPYMIRKVAFASALPSDVLEPPLPPPHAASTIAAATDATIAVGARLFPLRHKPMLVPLVRLVSPETRA